MSDDLYETILERGISIINSKEDIKDNIKFIKGVSKHDNGDKLRGYEIGTLGVVLLESYSNVDHIKILAKELNANYHKSAILITL